MSAQHLTMTRRELLSTAAIAAGAVVLTTTPAIGRPQRATAEDVILIDWDGFGSDLLDRTPMPNLQDLVECGSLSIADSTPHDT